MTLTGIQAPIYERHMTLTGLQNPIYERHVTLKRSTGLTGFRELEWNKS